MAVRFRPPLMKKSTATEALRRVEESREHAGGERPNGDGEVCESMPHGDRRDRKLGSRPWLHTVPDSGLFLSDQPNRRMAEAAKRPFWMHQLVEYILGGALVASGLQSPQPLVPSVLGGIVLLHAAVTRGALAAFRLIDRKLHRVLDPLVIGLEIVGALQPWISVDNGSRFIIGGIAAVHVVVWLGSSFTEKAKKPKASGSPAAGRAAAAAPAGDRSAELGRSAGRLVGNGVQAVRKAKAKRSNG